MTPDMKYGMASGMTPDMTSEKTFGMPPDMTSGSMWVYFILVWPKISWI